MIADVANIGWILPSDYVLDATYGGGLWWSVFCPEELVPYNGDFTQMHQYEGDDFDVAAFDPPYVAPGGRTTSTIQAMWARYAMGRARMTPERNQLLINDGVECCWGAIRHRGLLLVKCMSYVSGGNFYDGVYHTKKFCVEQMGMKLEDEFIYLTANGGPQPGGRTRRCPECNGEGGGRVIFGPDDNYDSFTCSGCNGTGRLPSTQQHGKRNASHLLVLRKM